VRKRRPRRRVWTKELATISQKVLWWLNLKQRYDNHPLLQVCHLTIPKPVKTKADDDFLAGLLGEVDSNIPRPIPQPTRGRKVQDKRKTRALSPSIEEVPRHTSKKAKLADSRAPTTPPTEQNYGDDGFVNMDDGDLPMDDPQPSSPITKAVERKSHVTVKAEDDDEEDMMEVAQADGIVTASVNLNGTRPVPKIKKVEAYPSPASSSPTRPPTHPVDASAWNDVTDKLIVVNSSQASETMSFGKLDYNDAIEEDGSLRMFWTDYTEINGSLCLFGKVQDKKTGAFVSCFVKVDNILRKLFFLPRQYRQKHGRDTTEEVDMKDVYEEVDELMTKLRVGMHKIKPCTRKYAFELPDVPREGDYLKLFYPYSSKSTHSFVSHPANPFKSLNFNLNIRPGPHSPMCSAQTLHCLSSLFYGKILWVHAG
jgi:DNA polymerase alpha subunit A